MIETNYSRDAVMKLSKEIDNEDYQANTLEIT